jgi:hypothetical protein
VPAFDPQSVSPGLSPWLLDRLGVDGVERLPGREAMTLHAADALKACLLELDPLPYDPLRGRSLLGLLRQGVLGRLNLTPAEAI